MSNQKITKRKDGRFCANVVIGTDPYTGKIKRKMVYGRSKNEIKQKIKDLERSVASGEILPTTRSGMTLEDWCREWLLTYSIKLTDGTIEKYSTYIYRHIIPALGKIKLDKLTPVQCQQFINDKIKLNKMNNTSINHLATFFKSILNKAVILGYISKNPALGIELPKSEKPRIRPFNEEEASTFIQSCGNNTFHNLFKLMLLTGVREHEALALSWADVEENLLNIRHQFARTKSDKTFYPTKNKSHRVVGITEQVKQILEDQKKIQAQMQLSKGIFYRNHLDLIFTDESGDRLHITSVRRQFKKLCEIVGREDVRLHDLRHTYAVFNLQAGVDVKTISENLGHHSVTFTLDLYAYVTDNMRQESADKLGKFIDNRLTTF